MIEAIAECVIDKLIECIGGTGTTEDPIMNEMQHDVVADLIKEDLSSAGVNGSRKAAGRDRL